ncbi:MAG: serine hydrolase [Bacteroidota bacterium]
MRLPRFAVLLVLLCAGVSQAQPSPSEPRIDRVDAFAERVMTRYGLPGLSLIVQQNGEIVHRANYGYASLEHAAEVTDSTIFRVYSLTKLTVAAAVFQLVEAGQLSLSDTLGQHLDDLPEAWKAIRIEQLLTHSSGLPDMGFWDYQNLDEAQAQARIYSTPLEGTPGERFVYNQTNFWLLDRIIESTSGEPMESFVLSGQFEDAGNQVFFSGDSRQVIRHRATPYFPFATGQRTIDVPHSGSYLHAANGLNITAEQFLAWTNRLLADEFLAPETREKMWSRYTYANDPGRDYGHSWERRLDNGRASVGFSGSLVTALRLFHEDDLVVVFLANGMGRFFNIEVPVSYVAGLVDPDLMDPDIFVYESLKHAFTEGDVNRAPAVFDRLRQNAAYTDVDFRDLMRVTINFLRDARLLDRALAAATLNQERFPDVWMTYDQLALVQERRGDLEAAIANYRKALELNPNSDHSRGRLDVLLSE